MQTMEYIFILGGLLTLTLVVLASKYPVYSLTRRLKKHNISLTTDELKKLSNFYELSDDFLSQVKEILERDDEVSFVSLADYYRNVGNFDSLNEAMDKVDKSDKQIPINSVIMLLMTNKDVDKALELVGQSYMIMVEKYKEDQFMVDYKAEFEIEYEQSLWLVNDLELITKTVKSAISLCIVSIENKERKNIERELLKSYLNEDFWMTNASGIVLNQELKVATHH